MNTDRVYFVDDEEHLRIAAGQTFELADIEAACFDSPAAVLKKLGPGFDGVLVTDIRMPGMDGVELLGKALEIDPSLFNPDDKEVVEDLIVAAIKDAQVKAEETKAAELGKVTEGLNLPPGMKLPF